MALKGPEGLADEVNTYVVANFNAKRLALNTEYGGTVVLADLAKTYIGERSIASIPEYPAALIKVSDLHGVRVHKDFLDAEILLEVTVFVLDQDEEALERRIYRTDRAIRELLMEGQVSNDITWRHLDGGLNVSYSPVFTREGSFLKDVTIAWRFKKREDK